MFRRSALVLALLAAPSVPAAEWSLMSHSGGVRLEFDATSIARQGDTGTAWDRTVSDQPMATAASGDVAFHSAKTLMRYDCVRRTVLPMVRAFAFADGTEVLRQNVEGAELPQPVVADTPRERMLSLVCAVKARAEPAAPKIQTAVLPAASSASPAPAKPKAAEDKADAKPGAKPEAKSETKDDAKTAAKPADGKAPAATDPKAPAAAQKTAAPAAPAAAPAKAAPAATAKAEPAKPGAAAPAAKDAQGKPAKDAHGDKTAAADAHGDKHGDAKQGKGHGEDKAAKGEPAAAPAEQKHVNWSYSGVQQWHKLSKDFAACAEGKRQSPIDIREGVRVQLEPIKFNYQASPLRILNNGHTVQVAYQPGSSIVIGDVSYELVQFHFHHPAEERVNGRQYDMVAHLVHKSKDDRLAVVAVLLFAGEENEFIKTLWNYLPLDVGLEENLASVMIDVKQLLPKLRGYYTYMGSLTTPPCTEGVRWIVMRTPVQMSRTQVTTFSRLYQMNARPLQASNGRLIKEVM
jgi:carbonic anhydrase